MKTHESESRRLFQEALEAENRMHDAIIKMGHAVRGIVQNPMGSDELASCVSDWEQSAKRAAKGYKAAFENLKAKHKAIRAYVEENSQ